VIWQWADDAPADALARLHVRSDPLAGTPRPPSERTIRRTLAVLDPAVLENATGAFGAAARAMNEACGSAWRKGVLPDGSIGLEHGRRWRAGREGTRGVDGSG
jgi:hypothetical protein